MIINQEKCYYGALAFDRQPYPPCRVACPAGVDAQGYISLISQGKFARALEVLRRTMPFAGVCGRVCTHPCEADCERGKVDEAIAIRSLKRFMADYELRAGREKAAPAKRTRKDKVAIVGSGPAGLACAYDLIREGYPVTVFEAAPQAGGLLRYGIPEYRLPREILENEISYVEELGVEIKTNTPVRSLDEVFHEGYRAIFLGTGAGVSQKLGIPNEDTKGVIQALDFLRQVNSGKVVRLGARVAVIGGGNAAVDAARIALRLGAGEVSIIYRRSRAEMPAIKAEVEEAEREGVKIHFLAAPVKVLTKGGRLTGMECIRMELGEPDASGRRRPIPIEGSAFTVDVDNIIIATGQAVDKAKLPGQLEYTSDGVLFIDPITLQTNIEGVFAGGDAVRGPANVISAVAAAKEAAISIDRYLRGLDLREGRPTPIKGAEEVPKKGVETKARKPMPVLSLDQRKTFAEVELGFDEKAATEEAKRCLNCGCGLCIGACPTGKVSFVDGRVEIASDCLDTPYCTAAQICPQQAIERARVPLAAGAVQCEHCFLGCNITPDKTGECRNYANRKGTIVRTVPLTTYEGVREIVGEECDPVIRRPLITGIGAGTAPRLAPQDHQAVVGSLIVQDKVNGVDVVTCVSEGHFHFAGALVKVDSEGYLGEEGAPIFCKGTKVGMLGVEEYGSKMIHLGGANIITGKNGWVAAKVVADVSNREPVELTVQGGPRLRLQVGQKPIIDGKQMDRRRWGCGGETSLTLGTAYLKEFLQKGTLNGLMVMDRGGPTGHVPRRNFGVRLRFPDGPLFPYIVRGGPGWGMTPYQDPLELIESVDPKIWKPGFTLLITETSGDRCAFYEFTKEGKFRQVPIPREIQKAMDEFRADCEPARVSAYYMAGLGGTARRAVTKRPLRLSEALIAKKACLTVGGAPATVLTGGGVNLMVDVERVKPGAFTWTGAPACVNPFEFTMKLEDYVRIGGHVEAIKPLQEVLKALKGR